MDGLPDKAALEVSSHCICLGFRLHRRWNTNLQSIDLDCLGNVLEMYVAQVMHQKVQPRFHLPVGVF